MRKIIKWGLVTTVITGVLWVSPLVWVELGARYVGDPDAQRLLARWYQDGAWLHTQNKNEARAWLLKAVQQNNIPAQYDLALDLEKEKQFDQATQWFTQLANAGHVPSQYALGNLYLGYGGADRKPEQARDWLSKAALAGNANAQLVLGITYMGGEADFLADPLLGAKWIQEAANQNNARAQYVLAGLYSIGNGVAQSNELANFWSKKSRDAGYSDVASFAKELDPHLPSDLRRKR